MNEPYPPAFQRKFAVLGQRGVGKSSLTHYFATGRFINRYDPTIENTLRQTIVRDSGDRYHCEIVDTAGMDESTSSLSRNATVGVHGYLLVFSLASRHSLEQLRAINGETLSLFLSLSLSLIHTSILSPSNHKSFHIYFMLQF